MHDGADWVQTLLHPTVTEQHSSALLPHYPVAPQPTCYIVTPEPTHYPFTPQPTHYPVTPKSTNNIWHWNTTTKHFYTALEHHSQHTTLSHHSQTRQTFIHYPVTLWPNISTLPCGMVTPRPNKFCTVNHNITQWILKITGNEHKPFVLRFSFLFAPPSPIDLASK